MIEPISYGWVCPKCGRVYAPNQEMCLYCSGNSSPCVVEPAIPIIGPSNMPVNGTKGSPYYTTTTGATSLEGETPTITLTTGKTVPVYTVEEVLNETEVSFKAECNSELSEYTNK